MASEKANYSIDAGSSESSNRESRYIRKRAVIKSKLTMFIKFVESCEESGTCRVHQLRSRMTKLQEHLRDFEGIQEILVSIASDEMVETRISEGNAFEESYFDTMDRAQALLSEHETMEQVATRSSPVPQVHDDRGTQPSVTVAEGQPSIVSESGIKNVTKTQAAKTHVQLPTMHLAKFSGSYEAWPGFADTFRSAVHDNTQIRDTLKLTYLRSCLVGQAAEKIESLETTAANYSVAWNILQNSYDDPSIVINNRIKAMFQLPQCTKNNPRSLGELADKATKHYRALQALNKPVLEAFPIYAITSKLDDESRLRWREKTQGAVLPTMEELLEFLHSRRKILETGAPEKSVHLPITPAVRSDFKPRAPVQKLHNTSFTYTATQSSCHVCKGKHFTQYCSKLTDCSIEQRIEIVKNAKLCANCLRPRHVAKDCLAGTCKQCNGKHHTLLHKPQNTELAPQTKANLSTLSVNVGAEVLLYTAVVNILDSSGQLQPCRVLLDTGSQSHFITERTAARLGLPRQQVRVPVIGINQGTTNINNSIKTRFQSRINRFESDITFLVIPYITERLPSRPISKREFTIPKNLPLADPGFNKPSEIDGLIGAELFARLLCVGQVSIADTQITLQKTKLGWVISGTAPCKNTAAKTQCNIAVGSLQEQLAKFWEIEELPNEKVLSREERACENHYQENTIRDPQTGRYITRLPFKHNTPQLGESHSVALKRFQSLERKLLKNPELKLQYARFLEEYRELGHMSQVEAPSTKEGSYLPHHAVVKQSSLTTKLRVVFDASAKTSSGISLNETLLTGPTIQDELYSLLVRFRSHSYVITADIEKMYRQIQIHPHDRVYQKILWRAESQGPIETYTLNTVTYGTSAAPFLATRTLQQLAEDEGKLFPRAAVVLREDFYVDDLLTGTKTYDEAISIRDELIELCMKGGFKLRQWAANDKTLINTLDDKTNDNHLRLDLDDTIKTLGIQWNARQDTITYTIQELTQTNRITKRAILSQIATLFDPLGLLGPIIVTAKILMQQLWKLQLDWDESVPADIYTNWRTYCQDLKLLDNLNIPRQITAKNYVTVQMHGFCDASEQAYGACVYLRSTDQEGNVATHLVSSKSRVAPLKTISLPRLELCAAHLLTKLYKTIIHALRRLTLDRMVFWSDSTIVLHWIQTSPHLLKTFVAHRIADIQSITANCEWRHVSSEDNPADFLSRGMTTKELIRSQRWHHGPSWLKKHETEWPADYTVQHEFCFSVPTR